MTGIDGQVAIAGIGYRQFRRGTSPWSERGVLVRVILDACADAGISASDVDGFVSYGDDHNHPVGLMADLGTTQLNWASQVWGGGGGGSAAALGQAAAAILSGQARVVVVYRALVEDVSGRLSGAVMAHHLNDHLVNAGIVAPAQICALRARRLFDAEGVDPATCAALVRASYFHGSRNPESPVFNKPLDVSAIESSRWIAEPFRLFDCSRENDGAGALVLIATEGLRQQDRPAVKLLAVAQGAERGWGDLLENDAPELYATGGFRHVARQLWAQTGLGPDDIDVVQLYENFSAQGVAALIDHGFCSAANAGEVLRFDNLVAPHGRLPVNTSGGNLAHGFVHGIVTLIEGVRCLRGDSPNPVPGAKHCLVTGGPAAPYVSSAILSTA